MSASNVQCQCCGKMMVPRVIFGRGIRIGYGLRIGGGAPESSCCPFCLREEWDGVKNPGIMFSVSAIVTSIFAFFFILFLLFKLIKALEGCFGVDLSLMFVAAIFSSVAFGIYMEHWLRITPLRRLALGIVVVCMVMPIVSVIAK